MSRATNAAAAQSEIDRKERQNEFLVAKHLKIRDHVKAQILDLKSVNLEAGYVDVSGVRAKIEVYEDLLKMLDAPDHRAL